MKLSTKVRDLILERLNLEIEKVQYFTTEYDPAWYFMVLNRLFDAAEGDCWNDLSNPCAAMAGYVWSENEANGRFQERSRDLIIRILFGCHNEVQKMLKKPIEPECGAV